MTPKQPAKAGKGRKRPTDKQIRRAMEADMQQWLVDSLTPDRGYSTPIDNIKKLFSAYLP